MTYLWKYDFSIESEANEPKVFNVLYFWQTRQRRGTVAVSNLLDDIF